jgi:hypothetical protein
MMTYLKTPHPAPVKREKEGNFLREKGQMLTRASIFALCCALPITAVQADDCPTHAVYDATTKNLAIPFVDVPLLDPWTGEMTDEMAVFSAELELLKGVEDFQILPNGFQFIDIITAHDECHAQYKYAEGKFDDGGTLHIPYVDVPLVMVTPPGIQTAGPVRVVQATLRQLAIDSAVFHLDSYCDADDDCGADDDPCTCACDVTDGICDTDCACDPDCGDCACDVNNGVCDPDCACDTDCDCPCPLDQQAQLMEPFNLYIAIRSMVVADYQITGEWPIPLSSSITPPTGVYTDRFETHEPLHLDAIMKTEAEGVAACFAGKTIHFIFIPNSSGALVPSCETDIAEACMKMFPMTCTHP